MNASIRLTVSTFAVLAASLMARAAAADPKSAASASSLARYVGLAPDQVAVFDVIGEHGMEHEAERRNLAGRLLAVGYANEGQRGIVTIYHPNKTENVLVGCPVTFMTTDSSGATQRDADYQTAFACSFLLDAFFPADFSPTEESVRDVLQNVYTLHAYMPANLKVQTVPSRTDAGWVRLESLARPSDPKVIAPGNSRLMSWDAKYDVDAKGMLALADNRYKLEVSDQGNSIILVSVRLARSSLRPQTPAESARLKSDIAIVKSIARDWILDRGRAMKSVDYLIEHSKDCVFASELPFLKEHLQSDIKRLGERDAWRYPKVENPASQAAERPKG